MSKPKYRFSENPALAREGGIRGRSRIRTRKILEYLATGPIYSDDRVRIIEAAAQAPEIEAWLEAARAEAAREAGE